MSILSVFNNVFTSIIAMLKFQASSTGLFFMRTLFSCLLCFALLSDIVLAESDTNQALDNAKRQLELLDPQAPKNKTLRAIYLQIIESYSQISATELKIASFKQNLKLLPTKTIQLQAQLKKKPQKNVLPEVNNLPLQDLERALTQLQSTQLELQQNRNKIDNKIKGYAQKPNILRKALADIKNQQSKQNSQSPNQAQQQLETAQFLLNNLEIQSINLELLVIPLLNEYDRLRLNWTDVELNTLGSSIRLTQDKVQQLRQNATDKLLEEVAPAVKNKNNPAKITQLVSQNSNLSEQLRNSVSSIASTVTKLRILEQQYKLIKQSYNVIQQQLQLSENSFGVELRNFSQRFSTPTLASNTPQAISKIRLRNIELDQLTLNMAINRPDTTAWEKDSLEDLQSLETTSVGLINNLHNAYNRQLDELSKVLNLESQIEQQHKQGQKLLTEYLLWLPSVPSVTFDWPSQINTSSFSQLNSAIEHFQRIEVNPISQWLRWLIIYIVVTALAIFALRYHQQHEKIWSRQIGNVVQDRFSRTLKLVFMAPIICLPVPLLLYLTLNNLITIDAQHTNKINDLLCLSLWIYTSIIYWLKRPYGLFISHLDIPEDFCVKLKQLLLWLYTLGAPITWVLIYIGNIPSLELHAGLGRLLLILLAILAGSFWAALWKVSPHVNPAQKSISWWQQSKLWLVSLVIIHVLLVIAGIFGYLFTVSTIMSILLAVSLILASVFTIYRLGVRWLLIAERRMTFAKARLRRSEILAAREKNEEITLLEENYLGLKSVSEQAAVLLKALCLGLLLLAMYLLVKNFLPSLDVLDKVVLWSNDITTASGVISEQISLGSIITSLFVIGITILAAYNLPGLLELLILRHINLSPGTCYAITSITRYLLIIVSVLAGANQIGVEWAKLQWLVAAMGVGLGFGLQEIVANFVSGIIILFEKPVRIGDTVTIGGVTGKVTKIKIRATTIADWDRKEVIIPNKTFVTDQLINWSLSDAITRVIINIGVAYGSDTYLVHKLIEEAALSNLRVLKEPEPEVFFTTFGNSTLDFELRFFVSSLADRNLAIHEINQVVNQVFKDHNISIAFPQLDVHLHPS